MRPRTIKCARLTDAIAEKKENRVMSHDCGMFEPVSLSPSNVPHSEPDLIGRLHGDELGPFSFRTVRDLDYTLALSLLTIDSRYFVLGEIDMGDGTI